MGLQDDLSKYSTPEYRKALEQEYAAATTSSDAKLDEVKEILLSGSTEAAKTLVFLSEHATKESTRLKAASQVLTFVGVGKDNDPTKSLEKLLGSLQPDVVS